MNADSNRRLEIEFLSGPRDGDVAQFDSASITIGRESRHDLVIVSDSVVSRQHAKLHCADGRVFVEDIGSSFGTFVNGEKIRGPREIGISDVVSVGHTEFLCRILGPNGDRVGAESRAAEVGPNH